MNFVFTHLSGGVTISSSDFCCCFPCLLSALSCFSLLIQWLNNQHNYLKPTSLKLPPGWCIEVPKPAKKTCKKLFFSLSLCSVLNDSFKWIWLFLCIFLQFLVNCFLGGLHELFPCVKPWWSNFYPCSECTFLAGKGRKEEHWGWGEESYCKC